MTHWFLSFLFRRRDEDRWQPQDATTYGEHPLDYIVRARTTYPAYEYRLMFFHAIPEDVFTRVRPDLSEPPSPIGAVPQRIVP